MYNFTGKVDMSYEDAVDQLRAERNITSQRVIEVRGTNHRKNEVHVLIPPFNTTGWHVPFIGEPVASTSLGATSEWIVTRACEIRMEGRNCVVKEQDFKWLDLTKKYYGLLSPFESKPDIIDDNIVSKMFEGTKSDLRLLARYDGAVVHVYDKQLDPTTNGYKYVYECSIKK
ncbi:hypothetical protein [Paenibacillus medicaginis]|uniref:Uncharacterized protein n=1 Tax=Paenibacillus medicaginis TaxID=1470560 RepID=A0ABV5C0P8_9BACL